MQRNDHTNNLDDLTCTTNGISLLEQAQKKRDTDLLNAYYKRAEKYYTKDSGEGISTSGIDSTVYRRTILFWAIACFQSQTVIKALIKQGSSPKHEMYYDTQLRASLPLFTAIDLDNIAAIDALLQYDAGLTEEVDVFGATSAHYAAKLGKIEVLKKLFEYNTAIARLRCNTPELTPLHTTAMLGQIEAAKWLLDNDDQACNLRDATGHTALHLAILNGHEGIVDLLLDNGANFSLATHADAMQPNKTPLQLAAAANNDVLVRLLMKHGARPDEHNPVDRSKLSDHVNIALSLLDYIDDRNKEPAELKNTIWGYNPLGVTKKDKIEVATKVIYNIFNGEANPLYNLTTKELGFLQSSKTAKITKPLFQQHGPDNNRVSPPNSTRTSPSPKIGTNA
jgi:ankyrin repeat protein